MCFLNIFFNPVAFAPRKPVMIQQTAISTPAQRRNVSSPYGGMSRRNVQRQKKNLDQTSDHMQWINCIHRIRDEQDQSSFAALFRHFAPRVKAYLMKSGANATLAEETSQEVMATVWQKAHMFDASRASVSTWIFTIARNRMIDAIRKQNRPEPDEIYWQAQEEPDQADVVTLQQESARLTEALKDLPEKQRELIIKAYFGDLSHSEIAEQTGIPLGTIKSRIRLALDRLRHSMK